MKIIIDGYNKTIHKQNNHIIIKDNNKTILDELATNIDNIVILGKGHITFDALNLLSQENVNIISTTYNNQIRYTLNNHNNTTKITLLKKQVYHSDSKESIKTCKEIIRSKIKNQTNTLKTLNRYKKHNKITENIEKINTNLEKLETTQQKNQIRGIEGICSNLYWLSIKEIIPPEYNFKNRTKRPAKDVVNAMLNYGYAILASQITIKIIQNGLNPDIGLLHSDLDNRHSLTYDIIEEFRQQIVDKTIISMINNKQITTEDYQENLITLDKRKIIIEKILKKLENKIVYKNKEYTYDEIIDKQINNLKEVITKDTEYEGFYLNW